MDSVCVEYISIDLYIYIIIIKKGGKTDVDTMCGNNSLTVTQKACVLEVYLMGIYGLPPSRGYKSRGDGQTTIQSTAECVPHSTF